MKNDRKKKEKLKENSGVEIDSLKTEESVPEEASPEKEIPKIQESPKTEKPKPKAPKEVPKIVPRGKKGKLKKMKEKYGDQDEEERALRMALLQSEGKKDSVKENSKKQPPAPNAGKKLNQTKKKKIDLPNQNINREILTEEFQESPNQEIPKIEDPKIEDLKIEIPSEEGENLGKRVARKERREEEAKEAKELQALLEEENISLLDSQASGLDLLTGKPMSDDILVAAIPMCGPYSVFSNWKYKVKLTPGSDKRGKAVKMAMTVFQRHPEGTQIEKDLLKAIPEEEFIRSIISNCKVSSPGLFAQKKK